MRTLDVIREASGITVAMDCRQDSLPSRVPVFELWPLADPALFYARRPDPVRRRALGVPENSLAVVFQGDTTAGNARHMRSLYLAVAVLNREGYPTTLVRSGRDLHPFLRSDDQWRHQNTIELGHLSHSELPGLLALADILVQPAHSGAHACPRRSELFSAGRPLILPEASLAPQITHRRHAFLVRKADALGIAAAINEIRSSPELHATLSAGALEFFHCHLDPAVVATNLDRFYRDAMASFKPCPN